MANYKPRKHTPHTFEPDWAGSDVDGAPRRPAIDGIVMRDDGDISFTVRCNPRMPRADLDKALLELLTGVLAWDRGSNRLAQEKRERIAVAEAYERGTDRKLTRTPSYIAKATGLSEHRVKTILRDYRRYLAARDSKTKARRRGKRGSRTNPIVIDHPSHATSSLTYVMRKKRRR